MVHFFPISTSKNVVCHELYVKIYVICPDLLTVGRKKILQWGLI